MRAVSNDSFPVFQGPEDWNRTLIVRVSQCRESLEWLRQHDVCQWSNRTTVEVYEQCVRKAGTWRNVNYDNVPAPMRTYKHEDLPCVKYKRLPIQRGRESASILYSIVNGYEKIQADAFYVFLQGNPFHEIRMSAPKELPQKLRVMSPSVRFASLSGMNTWLELDHPLHHKKRNIAFINRTRSVYNSGRATMVVRGDVIRNNPWHMYTQMLDDVWQQNTVEGEKNVGDIYEMWWSGIFNCTVHKKSAKYWLVFGQGYECAD